MWRAWSLRLSLRDACLTLTAAPRALQASCGGQGSIEYERFIWWLLDVEPRAATGKGQLHQNPSEERHAALKQRTLASQADCPASQGKKKRLNRS